MRSFTLMHKDDNSRVAEGVEFVGGTVALNFMKDLNVTLLPSMGDVYRVWGRTCYVKRDRAFPHKDNGRIVIGPECYADDAGVEIEWAGMTYKLVEEGNEYADRLSSLLCELTGGRLSKPTYDVRTMVQAIEEYMTETNAEE